VIHIDQEGARLYTFNLGVLEGADGYIGEEVKLHRSGGWSNPRIQRHELVQARRNLQDAAEAAEEFYRDTGTRRLILAGTDKNVAHYRDLLSHRLRAMVIGQIAADANASPNDLRDKALELADAAEKRESAAIADRIIAATQAGGNAVLGLADTLTAVQFGRASHVVALASYAQPAYRFVDSGHIVLELSEDADLQSGRVQNLPDGVESCLRRALAQDIGVTVLDQHAGLEQAGKIGALTRY
jgi:peptide subunit release factor 1 (eRF1)